MPHTTPHAVALRAPLTIDRIHTGDLRDLLPAVAPASVDLGVWSPPYFVGKSYEQDLTFEDWQALLRTAIAHHARVLKPGGFLAINIADILCFQDPAMPRVQAANVSRRRSAVTREDILRVRAEHPEYNRYQLAQALGCSEQTIQRRIETNNVRGGKYHPQTRTKLVGGMLEAWALEAGLYCYDRRAWVKDPAWENSRWHTTSYRAIDEFEYVYVFWKPGITEVDRARLTADEWRDWGSRAVWHIPSVRANDDHPAKYPMELARRIIRLLAPVDGVVLDCFMGSGTTAVAAIESGRRYLGIERDPHWAELGRTKAAAARARLAVAS